MSLAHKFICGNRMRHHHQSESRKGRPANSPQIHLWEQIPAPKYPRPEREGLNNESSCRSLQLVWRVRPSIRFCLSFCVVRSKGEAFPSRSCKIKNLTSCNQKHRSSLYLLGKCFAPISSVESLGSRTLHQFQVPSSEFPNPA